MNEQYTLISTIVVGTADRVLLVQYGNPPDGQRGWFLPHAEVQYLEHPRDAALRALAGHIAIDPEQAATNLQLCDVDSFEGNDGSWHLPFHFRLTLSAEAPQRPDANLAAYRWFPLSELPERADVAHHGWALDIIESVVGS